MTHKVGTITLGVTMVAIGVLYIAQIFLLLGVEILIENARKNGEFIYDKTGIVLTFVLTFFAFVLAAVQQAVEISVRYGWRM